MPTEYHGASLLSMARAIPRSGRTPTGVLEAQYGRCAGLAGLPIGPRWQSLDRLYVIRRELRARSLAVRS